MDLDRSRLNHPVVAPHTLEQTVAREHAVAVLDQMAQQLEFPPRQSHRHTVDRASVFPFNHFMRECYNTPEGVYDTAKRRGMDLVTVTDHDQISAPWQLPAGRMCWSAAR